MLSEKPFTRQRIEQLLTDLGARLELRGLTGEVLIFDGGAMILALNARAATRDIDAVFAPDDAVRTAADEVAKNTPASRPPQKLRWRPQQLLAMKVLAGRRQQDAQDIRFLLSHLGMRT